MANKLKQIYKQNGVNYIMDGMSQKNNKIYELTGTIFLERDKIKNNFIPFKRRTNTEFTALIKDIMDNFEDENIIHLKSLISKIQFSDEIIHNGVFDNQKNGKFIISLLFCFHSKGNYSLETSKNIVNFINENPFFEYIKEYQWK